MVAGSILNECKSILMKNPLKNKLFFELLLSYQELLYFNFCLDFHMFLYVLWRLSKCLCKEILKLVTWLYLVIGNLFSVFFILVIYINIRVIKKVHRFRPCNYHWLQIIAISQSCVTMQDENNPMTAKGQ